MKISLPRKTLHKSYKVLYELYSRSTHKSIFRHFLKSNLEKLQKDFEIVESLYISLEPSVRFLEYRELVTELQNEYCEITPEGQITFKNESLKDEFYEKYKILTQDYSSDVVEHDSYSSEVSTMLEDTIEVTIDPIPFKWFPEDTTAEEYDALVLFRKETDKELEGILK